MQVTSREIFKYVRRTFKSIVFALNIVALLALLSAYISWHLSPTHSLFFAYLGLGFPIVLLVNSLFVLFWLIIRKWKIVGLNLLILILCYAPITAFFPLNVFSKTPTEDAIKIMSYNVRAFNWELSKKWNDDMPIIQYLKANDPDIICFQEFMVSTNETRAGIRGLKKILKKYPYYHLYPFSPSNTSYKYGLACFSKYPIKSTEKLVLNTSDNGAIRYEIDIDGRIVNLINVHLESNRLTTKDKELYRDFLRGKDSQTLDEVTQSLEKKLGLAFKKRAAQVDTIATYIDRLKEQSIIVCGDFNDSPISYSYSQIKENLVDAYAETALGPAITYHENYFWFRIDFIMHSKDIQSYNCKVDKVKMSDHYPIHTQFSFKK